MSAISLQSVVSQGTVEVVCGANVATYTGGLNAESRPHGFGGSCTFRTITDHCEFVGLWRDGLPVMGVIKVAT
jgi:hypothetical protein